MSTLSKISLSFSKLFSKNSALNTLFSKSLFSQNIVTHNATPQTLFSQKNNHQITKTIIVTSVMLVSSSIYAKANIPKMDNTAYVLMDYNTGTILAQENADKQIPPASLTKMMTSYIIEHKLENGELQEDDGVTISKEAWCGIGSGQSCMYAAKNSQVKVIDLLRGIIIQSGNDASRAMAEHIAGDEASFADVMNIEAKKLGMTNTQFMNATGMPAEGHYSSAMDLSKLARAIIQNSSKYYSIYAEEEFTYAKISQKNRNSLLFSDATVDGLKTGHTKAAGYCLVTSSEREEMRLISVIMGTKSKVQRAKQSRLLLNWGFNNFQTITQAPKGQYATKIPVWFGEQNEVELATAADLQVLVSKNQQMLVETVTDYDKDTEAPITKGQVIGKMHAVVAGKNVASVDLVATHDVARSGFVKGVWQHVVKFFKGLF